MDLVFYISAAVAVVATALVVTGRSAVHALLYLVVSLLAVAMVLFALGASFAAALEVIVYAGAIMVLFVFVIMMLNLGQESVRRESEWLSPRTWRGPALMGLALLVELVWVLGRRITVPEAPAQVPPEQVGAALFGQYLLAVELAGMLLLAGLVGVFHLARREGPDQKEAAG
jgi:NADH-quinone oxidoreductase subunit J